MVVGLLIARVAERVALGRGRFWWWHMCTLAASLSLAPEAAAPQVSVLPSERVARLVLADLAVRDVPALLELTPLSQQAVEVTTLTRSIGPLPGYRARYGPSGHGRFFLVAVAGEVLLRLGGFVSPELEEFDRRAAMASPDWKAHAPIEKAMVFSMASDAWGLSDACLQGPSVGEACMTPEIVARWQAMRPLDWPPDTLVRIENGMAVVGITVIAKSAEGWTGGWIARYSQYIFERSGALAAFVVGARELPLKYP